MKELQLQTKSRTHFVNITAEVQKVVSELGLSDGFVTVFVPHTTAGVTINENADPDVVKDMSMILDEIVPWEHPAYRHAEGNTAAHVKASMMGSSTRVIVKGGKLQLGTWQGVFFCEFDGPRTRSVWISS